MHSEIPQPMLIPDATQQAHQQYIEQAEADHRKVKAEIRRLRETGLLSEADKLQREYLLNIDLGFMSMYGRGWEYCEHRSTLRLPVLCTDCPACP